jgi:hypothetical protein
MLDFCIFSLLLKLKTSICILAFIRYTCFPQLFNLTLPTRRRAIRVVQVDATGEEGMSALHTAALLGLAPTCRLLIHLGAHRYACNADGATPADVARRAGYDR